MSTTATSATATSTTATSTAATSTTAMSATASRRSRWRHLTAAGAAVLLCLSACTDSADATDDAGAATASDATETVVRQAASDTDAASSVDNAGSATGSSTSGAAGSGAADQDGSATGPGATTGGNTSAAGSGADSVGLAPANDGREKAIMDVDMGQLNDDAVAMFMLTQSSDTVDLLGVTTVAGNTWLEEGTQYSLRQLELIGRDDVPVHQGAEEPLMGNRQPALEAEEALFGNSEYLGSWGRERPASYTELDEEPYGGYATTKPQAEHAVEFMARTIRQNPHEVTIFALGPATNIALLVRMHPDVVPLVKQIIYMGGAIDIPGNTTPAAEFNWWYDPEAIKIALRAPFAKQIVVPNDIAEAVNYTKDEYDRIVAGEDTPITQMFADLQGEGWESDPDDTSFVWDSMTAAIFLDPSIATSIEQRYIDIDTTFGPNYGRSIGYHESRRRELSTGEGMPIGTQKVDILFDIDRAKFWNLYTDLMGAPLAS